MVILITLSYIIHKALRRVRVTHQTVIMFNVQLYYIVNQHITRALFAKSNKIINRKFAMKACAIEITYYTIIDTMILCV